MTIEKVKLTDFPYETLKAVYVALGLALVERDCPLSEAQKEAVKLFMTQVVNANAQREVEEKIIQN